MMNKPFVTYKDLTEDLIQQVEKAITTGSHYELPWMRISGMPSNIYTGDQYTGINILLLWVAKERHGFKSDYWMTFNQLKMMVEQQELDLKLKGEGAERKATGRIVRYVQWLPKQYEDIGGGYVRDTKTGNTMETHYAERATTKVHALWNADQIEGLPAKYYGHLNVVKSWEAVSHDAHQFIAGTGAVIRHGGDAAYYRPSIDECHLPMEAQFDNESDYLSVAFHELGHWTGHEKRLARDFSGRMGSVEYAKEELVAEITASFLCSKLGLQPKVKHADYLASYLQCIKNDSNALHKAASQAQDAIRYMEELQDEANKGMGVATAG